MYKSYIFNSNSDEKINSCHGGLLLPVLKFYSVKDMITVVYNIKMNIFHVLLDKCVTVPSSLLLASSAVVEAEQILSTDVRRSLS